MRSDRSIDLTEGSIPRNLLRLSLPLMLSNFMQTLYNLIDAFWLGKIGENARGAVSSVGTTFPVIFFLSSFGFGLAIAGTAMVARFKGRGNIEKIRESIGQYTLLLIIFTVLYLTLSMVFLENILELLRVPEEIFSTVAGYMRVILVGIAFMFVFFFFQSFSHGMGDTYTPMKIQVVSVGLNLVLDPLLIFGVGFLPRMETMGAAYATLIARILAAVLAMISMKRHAPHLIPRKENLRPDWPMIKNILRLSIPASIGHSMTSFGFVFLQSFVNSFGTVVISAYSIGSRMTSLFMMPAMGISRALTSVVGQNLGAKKIDRAEKSVNTAFWIIMGIMTVGCSIFFLFGGELTRFFIDDPEVITLGKRMFEITALAANIFGVLFIFNGVFNGAGQTRISMVLNIARLWFLRIPLVFILSGRILRLDFVAESSLAPLLERISFHLSAFPYDALWWSMLVSNTVTALSAFLIYKTGSWKHAKID